MKWVKLTLGGIFVLGGVGNMAIGGLAAGLLPVLLGAGLCYWGWVSPDDAGQMLCSRCGTKGVPVRPLRGSTLITIILLICFFVPGLIYMIWRRGGKPACAACGSDALIPVGSPAAAGVITPQTHVKCPDCRELVLHDARKCKHCGCALTPQ